MMPLCLTKDWRIMELVVLINGGILLLIVTHEKSELHVTQMILVSVESEVDSIRFVPNTATLFSIKHGKNVQG